MNFIELIPNAFLKMKGSYAQKVKYLNI